MLAVEREDAGLGHNVVQAGDEELAADDGDARDGVFTFGDDGAPMLRFGIADVDLDNAVIVRVVVGHHVEIVVIIHRGEAAVDAVDDC